MKKTKETNAYDRCLTCRYLGDGCDGPNTLSMTLERWCEWCRALKRIRGMTNSEIAEISGVSTKTVEKIMAGQASKDIMRSTAGDITRALVGSAGQWPCSLALEETTSDSTKELIAKTAELDELRRTLEGIHNSYRAELETVRQGEATKIEFLRDEIAYLKAENAKKDKIIERLLAN